MKENHSILIDRLIGYCDKILNSLIFILFIILISINVIQIILRGFFRSSLVWVLELSVFLGIWIVLFGASIMFLRNTEIKVTIIVNYFPRKIRRAIEIFISILGVIFAICLIWATINYQKYAGQTHPYYLPFSFRVHTFPVYIFGVSIIYSCLNIIFMLNKKTRGVL